MRTHTHGPRPQNHGFQLLHQDQTHQAGTLPDPLSSSDPLWKGFRQDLQALSADLGERIHSSVSYPGVTLGDPELVAFGLFYLTCDL